MATEHRMVARRCDRGIVTAALAPAGAPVQYGLRLTAIGAYLWHGQFLSRDRTCPAMAELFEGQGLARRGDRDGDQTG